MKKELLERESSFLLRPSLDENGDLIFGVLCFFQYNNLQHKGKKEVILKRGPLFAEGFQAKPGILLAKRHKNTT